MQSSHFTIQAKQLTALLAMAKGSWRMILLSGCKKKTAMPYSQKCKTEAFIQQKLNYIHSNPCKGENKLANLPEEYVHSSAKFYIAGEQGIYRVTSHTELQDIDLTK